jgi:hypothetical protein
MKINIAVVFFVSIIFFPLFPTIMGASHLHINVLSLLLSLILLFAARDRLTLSLYDPVVIYYLALQVLIMPSMYFDSYAGKTTFAGLFSCLRPILLLMFYLSLDSLTRLFITSKPKYINLIVFLAFVYSILEVFLIDIMKNVVFFLYKREEKENILFVASNFFGTSYYAGYAFIILGLLSYASYRVWNDKFSLFTSILCIILIVFSQSKVMLFSLFLILFILIMFNKELRLAKYALVVLMFTILILLGVYWDDILIMLGHLNLSSVRSLNTLVTDPANSGTLLARASQIMDTFDLITESNILFGIGLGQGVALESWVASFLFRYGIFGVLCFLCLVCFLSYKCLIQHKRLKGTKYEVIPLVCFAWIITLPLTQLSSVMLETSKLAYLSAFMFSLIKNIDFISVSESNNKIQHHNRSAL